MDDGLSGPKLGTSKSGLQQTNEGTLPRKFVALPHNRAIHHATEAMQLGYGRFHRKRGESTDTTPMLTHEGGKGQDLLPTLYAYACILWALDTPKKLHDEAGKPWTLNTPRKLNEMPNTIQRNLILSEAR